MTSIRDNTGFTLVELLLAILMLSVGIMGVARVFVVADKHAAYAREETTASYLAQELREKIMCQEFNNIYSVFNGIDTDIPNTVPAPASEWAQHLHSRLGATGRGTVVVTTPVQDHSLPNGMVGVTLTIHWKEGSQWVSLPLRFNVAKIEA